jgi:hypothetical protein
MHIHTLRTPNGLCTFSAGKGVHTICKYNTLSDLKNLKEESEGEEEIPVKKEMETLVKKLGSLKVKEKRKRIRIK